MRRPICFPASPRRSTTSPGCTDSRRRRCCWNCSGRTSKRPGAIFDGLSPDGQSGLSNDPDILHRELVNLGFADPETAARHVAAWRSGKARSLRSPTAQAAFEAMLPGLMQSIATGADPDRALNRLSDIVERLSSGVNLFRLLEARPALARLLAKVLAHAPALAEQLARRPELFEGLFDASSFEMPQPAEEFARTLDERDARPPVRRRARSGSAPGQ